MVQCCDATAISFVTKVWGEVLAHFHTVTIKVTVIFEADCLACQDEFFADSPVQAAMYSSSYLPRMLV
jgi:hypothetical protein